MNCDIFQLLMLLLLLENEGIEQDFNSLIIMFLMMQSREKCGSGECANAQNNTETEFTF